MMAVGGWIIHLSQDMHYFNKHLEDAQAVARLPLQIMLRAGKDFKKLLLYHHTGLKVHRQAQLPVYSSWLSLFRQRFIFGPIQTT